MKVEAQTTINAPKAAVWNIITDWENAADRISGIEKIEILEKPENGLVGLKWRETRTMFGKTAVETMWITDEVEGQSYQTRAESHGSIYISHLGITGEDGNCTLTMGFDGTPVTFVSKLMLGLMGWMFKSATLKAIQQDLDDIKAAAEHQA